MATILNQATGTPPGVILRRLGFSYRLARVVPLGAGALSLVEALPV